MILDMVNFPTWGPDFDSHSPVLLDLLLSSDTSICSTIAFHPLVNSDHVFVSVFWLSNKLKTDIPFHCIAYDYSHADWDGLYDHLRDVPWEDVFQLSASTATSEFCECVQVGIDLYIPHHKYQVKPHSPPWFSAACAAALTHRNQFFVCINQNKSSESKGKFKQASNCCKRVLKIAKLACATKKKTMSLPRNLALATFSKLLIVFSIHINLLYLLYSTDHRCCLMQLIKQNCLLNTFLRTLILMTLVSPYLLSLLELIWNCIIFP